MKLSVVKDLGANDKMAKVDERASGRVMISSSLLIAAKVTHVNVDTTRL